MPIRRRPALLLALTCLTPALAHAQVNTGQDASVLPFVACNGRVGFRTSEIQQGQTDLTGDGDAFDFAFQVLAVPGGAVTNVGVDASGALACGGDAFAFGTSEAAAGDADLDADGDALDTVLQVYDAATATLTNVGLPVAAVAVSATGSFVAFTVPEAAQGPLGTDLDGDGDALDDVLHVYDVATATVTNVGVAIDPGRAGDLLVAGSRVVFPVNEAAEGAVLNGDLDQQDDVVHVYDVSTATLTNTGLAALPGLQVDGDVVAFAVDEAAQGAVSLNADLDLQDDVLHLYCLPGAACGPGAVDVNVDATWGFRLRGDLVAIRTSERNQQGVSLNGDLDVGDVVVHVYRISTATLTNTGLASAGAVPVAGDTVAIGVPEKRQGRVDLDGDGDTRDVVLHLWDAATDTATNTGLPLGRRRCAPTPGAPAGHGPCMDARDDVLVFAVSEHDMGPPTDLNGDGDTRDTVAYVRRLSTGVTTPTGLAVNSRSALVAGGTLGVFRISEKAQGAILNGDGDRGDSVQGVADAATGTVTNLGRATEDAVLIAGTSVVFRVPERADDAVLNADGDRVDAVLHFASF